MPFTNAQLQTFFEDDKYIGLTRNIRLRLEEEGITGLDGMANFDKDQLDTIASNLRRATVKEVAVQNPLYPFGAHVHQKIIKTCKLIRFYKTVGQDMTLGSLRYGIRRNFTLQWKALKDRKDGNQPNVPKITKELGILYWSEAF